jgi:hypothetical protein
MSGPAYVGFSNETLDSQPACKAGDEIDCPHCGGKHVLEASSPRTLAGRLGSASALEDSTPPMLLSYRCGESTYLAGVRGRSVVGLAADVSSEGSGAKQRHLLCDGCWDRRCAERNQAGRRPMRVPDGLTEPCCGCGKATASGIWVLGPRGGSEFGACAGHED